MGIRSVLSRPLAKYIVGKQRKWSLSPERTQHRVFKMLIDKAKGTQFGRDHGFSDILSYDDFKRQVPIRDYEGLRPYVEKVLSNQADVLWPGRPLYLSKTSGTTSGVKYIPITQDSIPNHINSARDALLSYVHATGNSRFLDGKLMFLSGSPELTQKNGLHTGRLSGIVNHHVPAYLRSNQMPSFSTNCIEDWEAKLDKVIEETLEKDMRLISGIPPWVQMYFDKIHHRTGKTMKEVFPHFSLFVYGGVNFEPYRKKLMESIGGPIDTVETYPASEGFIAYQDTQDREGLLLLLQSGIFFEFIPAEEYYDDNPRRLSIDEVELGVNYALIINSNAGLWGYSIGDMVKFVSKKPHRLLVTGRIKHFISAFGEHVIGEEVEKAMKTTMSRFPETDLVEFTVAPQVNPKEGLPLHEWYVEFANAPNNLSSFEKELNLQLQKLNTYYDDLLTGSVLKALEVRCLRKDAFIDYMRGQGKLGGQNKVPRLSNDRKLAEGLEAFLIND